MQLSSRPIAMRPDVVLLPFPRTFALAYPIEKLSFNSLPPHLQSYYEVCPRTAPLLGAAPALPVLHFSL